MAEERWFYRSDADWITITEGLKLTACPHCQVIGALIRHGFLRGVDKSNLRQKRCGPGGSFAATARHVAVAGALSASAARGVASGPNPSRLLSPKSSAIRETGLHHPEFHTALIREKCHENSVGHTCSTNPGIPTRRR